MQSIFISGGCFVRLLSRHLPLLTFVWIILTLGCKTQPDSVHQETLVLSDGQGHLVHVYAKDIKRDGHVLFFNVDFPQWELTARKICMQGFDVWMLESVETDTDARLINEWVHSQTIHQWGLVTFDRIDYLNDLHKDDLPDAMVWINPETDAELLNVSDQDSVKVATVIVASNESTAVYPKAQQAFKNIQEPKKFVLLHTEKLNSDMISTDQEPIIRRVIVLLMQRYVQLKF
jgi:hypothetical protein